MCIRDSDRTVCFASSQSTDLVFDVSGYTTGSSALIPLGPTRIYDSRNEAEPRCERGIRFNVGGTMDIVDLNNGLVTATATGVTAVNGPFTSAGGNLSKNCERLYVASTNGSFSPVRLSFSGAVLSSLPGSFANMFATDDGLVSVSVTPGMFGGSTVHVVDTGEVLFELPPIRDVQGAPVYRKMIGATADGSLLAISRPSAPGVPDAPQLIEYFDVFGDELGSWTAPSGAMNFSLSPAGTYLSYRLGNTWIVISIDGTYIATMPTDSPTVSLQGLPPAAKGWISDGSILVCARNLYGTEQRAMRWDLFSPLKLLVPSNPNMPCVDDAS